MVEGRAGRVTTSLVGEVDTSEVLEGAVEDLNEEASGEVAVALLESVLIGVADGETDDS